MSYVTGQNREILSSFVKGDSQPRGSAPSGTLVPYTGENSGRGRGKQTDGKTGNPAAGDLVYAKTDAQSFFYTDETMTKVYQGDRQNTAPYRTNNEIVGTATGTVSTNGKAFQVTWVNSYWRSGYFKVDLNPKKAIAAALGERITETVTSWVLMNNVYWSDTPVDKEKMEKEDDLKRAVLEYGKGESDSNEVVLYAGLGLAAAILFGGKKKRR